MRLRPRLTAIPLPLRRTLAVTAALLMLPATALLLVPRRIATGLDRLLPQAVLLQSFESQGEQPPPLWRQRLGDSQAAALWAQRGRLWWQFWGGHADAGAYLVLPAAGAVAAQRSLPRHALRLDDLLVVAPDPLALQLLQQQLQVRQRPPRGLALRCSSQLRQGPAVHWNAPALGQMLGPLAPLLQSVQEGCLQLRSHRDALLWSGEADAVRGAISAAPPPLSAPQPAPLPADQLLELRGERLGLLLRGVFSSPLLRASLGQRYGIGPEQQKRLEASPFRLRLRALSQGPFRAALELELLADAGRQRWGPLLTSLSAALQDQNLTATATVQGLSAWSREDGTVVGGWRWLPQQRLLLFLGPVPREVPPLDALSAGQWRLRLRPQALANSGLLPSALPQVVQRSQQLQLLGASPAGNGSQQALAGRLDW